MGKLGILERIIAKRCTDAEIDEAIDRGIKNFDAGKFVSADEFVERTEKYIKFNIKTYAAL
jgi:predicted transcriptional regulator